MILVSAVAVGAALVLLVVGMITSSLTLVYVSIGVSSAAAVLLAIGALREFLLGRRAHGRPAGAAVAAQPGLAGAGVGGPAAGAGGRRSADRDREPSSAGEVRVPREGPHAGGDARADGGNRGAGTAGKVQAHEGIRAGGDAAALRDPRAGEVPAHRAAAAPRAEAARRAETAPGGEPAPPDAARRQAARPDRGVVLVIPGRQHFHRAGCPLLIGRLAEELAIDVAVREGFSRCVTCHPGPAPGPRSAPGRAETFQVAESASTFRPPVPPAAVKDAGGRVRASGAGGRPANAAGTAWPATATGEAARSTANRGTANRSTANRGEAADNSGASPGGAGGVADGRPGSLAVKVVRGVSRYHMADCVLVSVVGEEDVDTMTLAEAQAAGCTPCRACHPD